MRNQENTPTADQLIRVHNLLSQFSRLKEQACFPLAHLMLSCGYASMAYVTQTLTDIVGVSMPEEFLDSSQCLLIKIPVFYSVFYFSYPLIDRLAKWIAKYAIAPEHTNPTAYQRFVCDKVLVSRLEIQQLIRDLERSIRLYKDYNRLLTVCNFFACFFIPYVAAIDAMGDSTTLPAASLGLHWNGIGVTLELQPELQPEFSWLPFLMDVVRKQQSIGMIRYAVGLYHRRQIPTKIAHFIHQLTEISGLVQSAEFKWEMLGLEQELDDIRSVVVKLSLDCPRKSKDLIIRYQSRDIKIHKKKYFYELSRLLEQAGLRVYAYPWNSCLYVVYAPLTAEQQYTIRSELIKEIQAYNIFHSSVARVLKHLNLIAKNHNEHLWQYEKLPDDKEAGIFYCDLRQISMYYSAIHDDYVELLMQLIPSQDVVVMDKIVTLKHSIDLLSKIDEGQFKQAAKTFDQYRFAKMNNNSQQVVEIGGGKESLIKFKPIKPKKLSSKNNADKKVTPAHYSIPFQDGITFFSQGLTQKNQPNSFAYPINIPYLPEGQAYAHVDPRVYPIVKDYLSPDDIKPRLLRGVVHGAKKGDKNKAVAEGIKILSHPVRYQGVDNAIHTAVLELKFTNGIRIFAHHCETKRDNNKVRTLYKFDGPVYAHKRNN